MALVPGCGGDDGGGGGGGGPDAGTFDAPPAVQPGWASFSATALAADAEYLYAGGSELVRIPLAGGEPETLYTLPPTDGNATVAAIHVAGDHLVFVAQEISFVGETTQQLMRIGKGGGTAATLASSTDQRAFLGVTVDGDQVYYSTFTNLYRVPLAGGSSQLVGESPELIQYWAVSPTIVGDDLYWAEGTRLYKIAKTASGGQGTRVAELGLTGRIIASGGPGEPFTVSLKVGDVGFSGALAVAEVDPTTGMIDGDPIQLDREVDYVLATDEALWTASSDGALRVPRAGGAAEQLVSEWTWALADTDDAVFAATTTNITRLAR